MDPFSVSNIVPGTILEISFVDNRFLFPRIHADASKKVSRMTQRPPHKESAQDQDETRPGSRVLKVINGRNSTPLHQNHHTRKSVLTSQQTMTTATKLPSFHIVKDSSSRIKKVTNGSSSPSVSCGVMKTAHLVAVTMLCLSEIFA